MPIHLIGPSRKAFIASNAQLVGTKRKCFIIGGIEPPVCVPPVITDFDPYEVTTGQPISIQATLDIGSTPGTWGLTVNPLTLSIDADGLITGTPNPIHVGSTTETTVQYVNDCGTSTKVLEITINPVPPTPFTLRYGNVVFEEGPSPLPDFDEAFFLDPDPSYIEKAALSPGAITGSYVFDAGDGVHQVMWIADSLLDDPPIFKVSLAPWGLTPGADTSVMNLTIAGISGKLYYTAFQNNGGYTLDITV